MPSSSARCSQLPRAEDKLPFYVGLRKLRDFVNGTLHSLNEAEITFPDIKIKDTDDVLQKTIIRISNKPFSELSSETLKTFGDKIPSTQMISKHVRSSPSPTPSSTNLVFNTDAITTQTMSILHNTNSQHNGNLFSYEQQQQQPQRVYLQTNGTYTPSPTIVNQQPVVKNGFLSSKNSFMDDSTSSTNAAVLAALANGGFNSSSSSISSSTTTTTNISQYPQTQTVSYSIPSTSNNTFHSTINSRLSSTSTPSFVIHHQPAQQTSSVLPRPVMIVNTTESLPSIDTILNSSSPQTIRTQQIAPKELVSSQSKPTFIVVPSTIKPITSTSTLPPSTPTASSSSAILLPKTSNSISNEKRSLNTIDDCSYVRYERQLSSTNNAEQFRFSFVIDEQSPLLHKRLRYVSINDL